MIGGYKQSQLGDIPQHWSISTVEKEANINTGKKDTQDKVENGLYPFFVRSNTIERINSYSFEGEAVLTSGDGVGVGKIYHYLNCKFDYHQRVYNIHNFSNNLNGKFFYYFFSNHFYQRVMRLSAKNSVDSVRRNMIAEMEIPIPPLPEQQKIAAILSTVDAKIDIIDQQITETQELKKGLMQRLLTKGIGHTEFKNSPLGRIPKSWEVVQIQKLLDKGRIKGHLDGNHGGLYPKTDEFINEGVPYISANCFLNGRVDFTKCKHLSMERSLQFRKGVAKNGDILFAHNATVGPVAFLETDLDFVILSTTATYYRLDNKTIDAKYWMFFLSSPTFKNQYEKVMGQSTRNQVPITMQRSFYTVLPAYEEQKAISDVLNTTDNKLEVLLEKKTTFQELKKGLMQQLLTGKIRVKV